jgi:hypothetical protein
MNELPPELQHALQNQRLLIVWGDVPFELPPRVSGERAVVIKRLAAEAAQLPPARIRLSVTPPLPILSLDPTDRVEREFGGRSLNVLLTRRDAPTARIHNLIKLAGDLTSRAGLVLSREEVQHLRADEDKRYLLDLVHSLTEKDSAVILIGCDPGQADFQAWWPIVRPSFGAAPIFAAGEPSGVWPDGVTYLGSVQAVVNAAFANVKAPIPKMEPAVSFDVSAETTSTTTRSGGVDMQAGQVEIGGDVVGRDKVSAGGHIIHAEPGSTVIVNEPDSAPEPAGSKPVPIEVQALRVDAAVPEQVFVDRAFDLAVAVRQMTSPLLAVKDLPHVEWGEVQTTWEKGTPLINLRAEVEAPDCDIIGKSSISFRLVRGNDSPLLRFQLKPRRAGEISVVVTVYQEDYWLGSARVNTSAAEQTTQPAGKVQLAVASQALDVLPVPSSPPPSSEEIASLQRQLRAARENLGLIEDRKAEYVLEVDVPLQLIKEERRLRTRVAELEAQLSLAGQQPNAGTRVDNYQPAGRPWNYAAIRQLLNDAFSDEELTTLCFDDFPSVYDTFGAGMSKSQKIQNLVEHCKRNLDVERLLDIISARNPTQFARFEPGLHL